MTTEAPAQPGTGQEPTGQGAPGQEPTTPPTAPPAPPAPPAPSGQEPTPPAAPEPGTGTEDPRIAAANREAANYRRQLREAEAERDRLAQAQMTDLERAQADAKRAREEADQLRAQQRALAVENALTRAAATAGIRPDDAVAFLGAAIEVDDNGAPVGVDAAVAKLLAERPYLSVALTPGQAGPGAAGAGAAGAQKVYKRSDLSDAAFFEEHRADILAAMSEGRIIDG